MVELVHETQILIAQQTQLFLSQLTQILPHQYHAAGSRFIQAAQNVHQGRFAATGRTDNTDALTFEHF